MCVFITVVPNTKLFAWGRGIVEDLCAMRDDEPRTVWAILPITY
jgi:hypothetical protein